MNAELMLSRPQTSFIFFPLPEAADTFDFESPQNLAAAFA